MSSYHQQSRSLSSSKFKLYVNSSYISKYHGLKQLNGTLSKFNSTVYTSNFCPSITSSPRSDRDCGQFKQLTKNYYQKKYLQLTRGSEQGIKQWRNQLMEEFKRREKNKLQTNCKQHRNRIVKKAQTLDQFYFKSQEASAINKIIIDKMPEVDLIKEQDILIQKNAYYLKFQNNVDYDAKIQYMMEQYKIIIDRIQNEAFKIQLKSDIQTKMEDYNDFYNYDSKMFNSTHSIFRQEPQYQFDKIKLLKQKEQNVKLLIFDDTVESQNLSEIGDLQDIFQQQNDVENDNQINQKEQNINNIQDDKLIEQDNNNQQKNDQQKKNKNQKKSKNIQSKEIKLKLYNHKFVDYMLSLEDIYSCDLTDFTLVFVNSQYENYEFADPDEDTVYKLSQNWIDEIELYNGIKDKLV